MQVNFQSVQQNLNQIAQICNQLSQNEQSNVSRLQQMQQLEQSAGQQLRQCAQLCNQVAQQVQQMTSQFAGPSFASTAAPYTGPSHYTGTSQYTGTSTPGMGMGMGTSSWSSIPVSTANAFSSYQRPYGFEASKELSNPGAQATGTAVFNTNKDLNQ